MSDDKRGAFRHGAGNPGQAAMRLFDWIVLTKYATDVLKIVPNVPLVFKLEVRIVAETREGRNSLVEVSPIGIATGVFRTVYERFGIAIGNSESVILGGYAILKSLRVNAIR